MKSPAWLLVLLITVAVSLATMIAPWYQGWEGNRSQSADLLQVALGDGRKLFAKHMYLKADAYFHNGYYPTIFDDKDGFEGGHITGALGLSEEDEKGGDFSQPPQDWLDAFGRNFFPSRHTHLGDADCNHDHGHDGACEHDHGHGQDRTGTASSPEENSGLEREMLPWLRMSVRLDQHRVETYSVGAYILRENLNLVDEAIVFLREGLRANPQSPELLFELGRIYREERNDPSLARNLWELAWERLSEREAVKDEPNHFLMAQILGNLGQLEEEAGNYSQAIQWLSRLETISPHAASIRAWIDELAAKEVTAQQ